MGVRGPGQARGEGRGPWGVWQAQEGSPVPGPHPSPCARPPPRSLCPPPPPPPRARPPSIPHPVQWPVLTPATRMCVAPHKNISALTGNQFWVGIGQAKTYDKGGLEFWGQTAPPPPSATPRVGLRGNVCPARARRATFLLTIPTSARGLPSDGEGPPKRP